MTWVSIRKLSPQDDGAPWEIQCYPHTSPHTCTSHWLTAYRLSGYLRSWSRIRKKRKIITMMKNNLPWGRGVCRRSGVLGCGLAWLSGTLCTSARHRSACSVSCRPLLWGEMRHQVKVQRLRNHTSSHCLTKESNDSHACMYVVMQKGLPSLQCTSKPDTKRVFY